MAKSVLILGAGSMQLPAIWAARKRGYRVVVADANADAPGAALADSFVHVDLKDRDGMVAAARTQVAAGGLDGVFTAGTDFSATVAYVAEALGFPGISYEAALNASDKSRMRDCFRKAGVPHPKYTVVDGAGRVCGGYAREQLAFPLVVKPVDNMGARGVVSVTEVDDISAVIADAAAYSRSDRVILEELIDGPEYSIDSVVIDGRVTATGVADRHIRFAPYFVEVGHTIPTELPATSIEELLRVFAQGVRALGIENGVAKGDVFLTNNGPVIGEIAARLSGGYMSGWTYPYSSGVDLTGAALDQALGLPVPSLTSTLDRTAAERALISCDGEVEEILGVDEARNMQGVRELFLRTTRGVEVRFPRNNVEKCANIIAVADSRREAIAQAEGAVAAMTVRLAPNTKSSHAYLFGRQGSTHVCYPAISNWLTATYPDPDSTIVQVAALKREVVGGAPTPRFSDERDWSYRTARQSFDHLVALAEPLLVNDSTPLDPWFWMAFSRGGLQGALYVIDSIRQSAETFAWRIRECRT